MKFKIYFISFLFTSCIQPISHENIEPRYNIEIDYLNTPITDKRVLNDNSLFISFDGEFKSDTIHIYLNNKYLKQCVLTSDESTTLAGLINVGNYKEIDNVGIRINTGSLVFVETYEEHYNLRVNLRDNIIRVKFYKYFPGFE